MREEHRGNPAVVVDDMAFGEAGIGVEQLVEVRQGQPVPFDLDLDRRWQARYLFAMTLNCENGQPVEWKFFLVLGRT